MKSREVKRHVRDAYIPFDRRLIVISKEFPKVVKTQFQNVPKSKYICIEIEIIVRSTHMLMIENFLRGVYMRIKASKSVKQFKRRLLQTDETVAELVVLAKLPMKITATDSTIMTVNQNMKHLYITLLLSIDPRQTDEISRSLWVMDVQKGNK